MNAEIITIARLVIISNTIRRVGNFLVFRLSDVVLYMLSPVTV
jgi:hypothetical protein